MNTEIEAAIKSLAKKAKDTTYNSPETMHYSQAVLNLTHALATLDQIKLNNKS